MKKILIIMAVMVMMATVCTACGTESKDHTGHLARHESVKTDLFDGSLMSLK